MTLEERLVDLFGLAERVPEDAQLTFEWGYLPQGDSGFAFVVTFLVAIALTVFFYRKEGRASRGRKALLGALRLSIFAVVAVILCEPRLAVDMHRSVEGHTVILWDTSLSMSLPDRYQEGDRRAAVAEAAGLEDPEDLAALTRQEVAWRICRQAGLLKGLEAKNTLLLFRFDDEPHQIALDASGEAVPVGEWLADEGARAPEALLPRGPATDLAAAVRKALEVTGGKKVAALVAITDGGLNKGEGAQGVVSMLSRRGIPFYAVGVGDPEPPRNLEVVEVTAEERVIKGDPMSIEGAIRARGYEGERIEVVLTVQPQDGSEPESEVGRQFVVIRQDGKIQPVSFRHGPNQSGEFVFRLSIPERPDEEPVTDDNSKSVTVQVDEREMRVLLIAGAPSFEYSFLKQSLIRERLAVVSIWLQSADERFPQEGNERIDSMPTRIEELEEYNLVILLDPNPRDFDAAVADTYKRYVAELKGGLLYMPGPEFAPDFLRAPDLRAFRQMLPVVLPTDGVGGALDRRERRALRATRMGVDHPATRLLTDARDCMELWGRLPGVFFSYPVDHVKPSGSVLVRVEEPSDPEGRPLIAAQFFDGGPVLYIGTSELWRWRTRALRVYDRFWVGALRFLAQGELSGGRQLLELLADKERYVLGQPIRVRANARTSDYSPLKLSKLTAQATTGGERFEVDLEPISVISQPGWYEATIVPPSRGTLEVSLRHPEASLDEDPVVLRVEVELPDIEFSDPRLDSALLSGIAAETSGALVIPRAPDEADREALTELADQLGLDPELAPSEAVAGLPQGDRGRDRYLRRALEAGDLPSLPTLIREAREDLVVAGNPIPLWDRWETLALILALFSVEWVIRKRSRMV